MHVIIVGAEPQFCKDLVRIVEQSAGFHVVEKAADNGVSEYLLISDLDQVVQDAVNRSIQRMEYKQILHSYLHAIRSFIADMPQSDQFTVLESGRTLIDSILQLANTGARSVLLRLFAGRLVRLLKSPHARRTSNLLPDPVHHDEVHAFFRRLVQLWLAEYHTGANGRGKSIIKMACDYIKVHYNQEIRITDMASLTHLSISYFSALFKQHTGLSFVHYVNLVRIEKAKELLLDSDAKIYEVADSLGFATVPYFNRLFKNVTGMSPNEFKRAMGL